MAPATSHHYPLSSLMYLLLAGTRFSTALSSRAKDGSWIRTVQFAHTLPFPVGTCTVQGRNPSHRWLSISSSSSEVAIEISPSDHDTFPLDEFTTTTSPFDPRLLKALQKQNIKEPTPIQAHGIPLLLSGCDVMASSQTGSGKTLFFGLPVCERLIKARSRSASKGPSALILNPTRELAQQTASALRELTNQITKPGIIVALATGGASVKDQRQRAQQCDILVATPGRLLQFLDERSLSLNAIRDVVCDESDRMVDLGFEPQLRRIAQQLKRNSLDRQTVLCSATFPPEVQRVAADFLKTDYYFVAVGRVGATHTGIHQKMLWAGGPSQRRKIALQEIQDFVRTNDNPQQSQVIAFCNTKDEAENVGRAIRQQIRSSSVRVVTGDKTQTERNKFLDAFRRGKVDILVATDVAARGLDVPTIGLVVQVDTPRDVDTFVHRVGRTGRAGAQGRAVAVVDGRSTGVAPGLVELLQEAKQAVPAWLLGMSYISRARALEEELAIHAGGGTLGGDIGSGSQSASDSAFSEQDFRSSADAGSWGADRDTSYFKFDEDAYSSLDAKSISMEILDVEATDSPDQIPTSASSDFPQDDKTRSSAPEPFKRQHPSKELRGALKRLNGEKELLDKRPSSRILSKLSQRGSDQRLRFEYLGLFEFDSEVLMSRRKDGQSNPENHDMPRVLMVAEKPSIAKAIADALSGPRGARQKRGISRALPVYEFTSSRFAPAQEENVNGTGDKKVPAKIVVTSVVGHVFSLGFDQKESQSRTKDPSEYFRLPVVKQEEGSTGKLRVVDHLRALAAECDHLVLWLDCDAEGENIAYEVMGVTRHAMEQKVARDIQENPDASPLRRVHRAQFSAITKEALRDAFGKLVKPDAALSQAVDARQELDLRVGVALTRLITWRTVHFARKHFSAATRFLSYGPCQTPALSFCVDRASEIETFTPQEYWKVAVNATAPEKQGSHLLNLRWIPPDGTQVASNRGSGNRGSNEKVEENASFDAGVAEKVAACASKPSSYATVANVERVPERVTAPVALNTVALLAAGSKTMGMSPKKVMQVAEKLYSAGFLSYPRTETTRYDPKGFDVRAVLRDHTSHPQWGPTASYLLRTKYANSGRPPSRGKDAGDHPPITCLKPATREKVGGGAEWRVYEFVARTFLGSLSDDLVFTREIAELDMEGNKFELQQIQVESLGFAGACPWVLRDIGAEPKSKNGKIKKSLNFLQGMKLPINEAKLERCSTRPPPFLQEHELIELMDKHRIGTDASMASHVNNIVERGYVVLCDETGTLLRPPRPPRPGQKPLPRQIGRYMVPSSLGIGLIDLFKDQDIEDAESPSLLARPAIRAQMEEEVKQIANGKLDKMECVNKNLAWFEARYDELVDSLSRRERINAFAKSLKPMKESLKSWRKLGVFEEMQPSQGKNPARTKSSRRPRGSGKQTAGQRKRRNESYRKNTKQHNTRGANTRTGRVSSART